MTSFAMMVCAVAVMGQFMSAKAFKHGGGGGGGGYGGGGGMSQGGGGYGGGGGVGQGGNNQPTPYNMGYEAPDEEGNVHFRQEEGDGNGNVRGSYGYKDSQGLYRMVQYTSGRDGFKATVKTNEPGTDGKENPADVIMNVEQTPAGIVEKYNRQSRNGGGYGQGAYGGGSFGGSGSSSGGYFQGQKSMKSGY